VRRRLCVSRQSSRSAISGCRRVCRQHGWRNQTKQARALAVVGFGSAINRPLALHRSSFSRACSTLTPAQPRPPPTRNPGSVSIHHHCGSTGGETADRRPLLLANQRSHAAAAAFRDTNILTLSAFETYLPLPPAAISGSSLLRFSRSFVRVWLSACNCL